MQRDEGYEMLLDPAGAAPREPIDICTEYVRVFVQRFESKVKYYQHVRESNWSKERVSIPTHVVSANSAFGSLACASATGGAALLVDIPLGPTVSAVGAALSGGGIIGSAAEFIQEKQLQKKVEEYAQLICTDPARLRQVLVQVAYDVMQSFEMQFVRLAHAHMSGPHVAMQYLAQDAAKRALRYLRGKRLNSPSVNLHQLFLEGVFGGTSYPKQGYTLGFEDNTSCSTADLYSKCGVEGGSNLVPWKRCKPGVYGCRRPVSFEVVGQDGVGMSENPEHIGVFVQYRLVPYEYALRPLAESEDTVRQLLHRINKEHPSLVDFMRDITSTSMATNAAGASASYSGSAKANDPWTPFSDDITKPLPMRQGITRPEFEARKKEADSLYDKADYVTALHIRQNLLDSISGSFPRTETCKLEFDIVQTLQALGKYDLALSILNDMSLIEECGRHFELSVARAKGVLLILRGRLNDARRTLEEALEFVEDTPGDIPGVLEMERNGCKLWLAHILCQLDGNYEEALRAFNELLPRCQNHPEYFQHVHNKSLVFLQLERHKNALDLLTGALTMCEKAWTKRHPYSLILQHNIARAHLEFGHTNTGDVQERVEHVLELRTSLLGEFHPSTVETKEMLQECVKRWEMNGNGIGDNDEENLIFFA